MNSQLIRAVSPLLALVAIGGAVGALLLLKFPLYTDEVQWKALGSRLFLDDYSLTYLFPACTAGFVLPVPISWWPSRLLDAALYGNASNPLSIRYFGVATYFVIWAGIGWIIHQLWRDVPLWIAIAVALGLTSFGMLTPILVMNRPEQGILIPFLAIIALYLTTRGRTELPSQLRSWAYALLLVLLVWMMLGAHLKSFVLLPVAILTGGVAIRRRLPLSAFLLLSGFSFYENYRLWATRTDCPQSSHLQAAFSGLSLSPNLLITQPTGFVERASADFLQLINYFQHALVSSNGYQSRWWPSGEPSSLDNISNIALILLTLVLVGVSLWAAWRYLRGTAGRAALSDGAIAFWLLAAILALATYQITKNFYEMALVWPLLVLTFLFALKDRAHAFRGAVGVAAPVFIALALICQFALIGRAWPHLDDWTERAAGQQAKQQEIAALAENCQLGAGSDQAGLLVDDFAYSVFWKTKRPIFNSYFYGYWATGLDRAGTVKALALNGEVADCNKIPEQYRGLALRSSDETYCCVHFSS